MLKEGEAATWDGPTNVGNATWAIAIIELNGTLQATDIARHTARREDA
jgi:hypothetical protein